MEHDNTPKDTVPNIEGTASSSPHQGSGFYLSSNKLEGQCIFEGRVEDTYPSASTCLVSLYNLQSSLPCRIMGAGLGRWFGSQPVEIPTIGTEVLVFVGMDRKRGTILGSIPSVHQKPDGVPVQHIIPGGGPNLYSDTEPFHHKDWKVSSRVPEAGAGQPADGLPGDSGLINDLGCFVGVLRSLSMLKGSDLAKIEAYAMDDLLNVIGHNMNTFTAHGEKRVFDDHGRITEEEQLAFSLKDSLGGARGTPPFVADPSANLDTAPDKLPIKDVAIRQVGKWRWKSWRGWLGDFCQSFICRPATGPGSLDSALIPDMGLYQEALTFTGQHLERSVLGGGIHKALQVAVPKKKRESDDPEGDKATPTMEPKVPFQFDPKHPMGAGAQSRDYFAYIFNKLLPTNRSALTKDWATPDEANCPAPGTLPDDPSIGEGFFREFPKEEEVMAPRVGLDDDTGIASSKFRVGEAFMGILPDGSVLIRDAWGSIIEMRAGHIIISASKDVNVTAGASLVTMAGDDLIMKARQSIDLLASKKQVRIKAGNDIMIHSERAGVCITAPSTGAVEVTERGERTRFTGIVFKSPAITASTDDFYLEASRSVKILGIKEKVPALVIDSSSYIHKMTGQAVFKQGDQYVGLIDGSIMTSGSILADGSLIVGGSVVHVKGVGTMDEGPEVKKNLEEQVEKSIENGLFESFLYSADDLANIKFYYRSSDECATLDAKWYAAPWQNVVQGLRPWGESRINETWPYPGEFHYEGPPSYIEYTEGNVNHSGKPRLRANQRSVGGMFHPRSIQDMKIHPER